jgi:hypothetical protein
MSQVACVKSLGRIRLAWGTSHSPLSQVNDTNPEQEENKEEKP